MITELLSLAPEIIGYMRNSQLLSGSMCTSKYCKRFHLLRAIRDEQKY